MKKDMKCQNRCLALFEDPVGFGSTLSHRPTDEISLRAVRPKFRLGGGDFR